MEIWKFFEVEQLNRHSSILGIKISVRSSGNSGKSKYDDPHQRLEDLVKMHQHIFVVLEET